MILPFLSLSLPVMKYEIFISRIFFIKRQIFLIGHITYKNKNKIYIDIKNNNAFADATRS